MALIQMSYLSRALFRTVPVQIVLPADKIDFETMEYNMQPGNKFKTLYLLHGLIGNYTDWVSGTRIQRWAEERNLAVVMPSGENSFYVDARGEGCRYGTFIGEELVTVMRNIFPLSTRREDTFLAGLSMGGFGAIRNGIRYSGTFSHVAAFSSGVHVFESEEANPLLKSIFGDMKEAAKTDSNPRVAWEDLKKENRPMPRFYLSCGTNDPLLPYTRLYRDLLLQEGADVTYREEEGAAHEWDFWDREIRNTLDWLPLQDTDSGLSSGHVRT